jgi:hypothetical protein
MRRTSAPTFAPAARAGMNETAAHMREAVAPRRCLLTWWVPSPGGFSARVVLDDGTLHDFDSPFELARFLGAPTRPAGAPPRGLR